MLRWLLEAQEKEAKTGISSRVLCRFCTEQMKKDRGCEGGVIWKLGPYEYDGCPEKLVPEYRPLIDMWQDWKVFGFPFPGHWSEQPKYIIETIRTLESEAIVIRKEK